MPLEVSISVILHIPLLKIEAQSTSISLVVSGNVNEAHARAPTRICDNFKI